MSDFAELGKADRLYASYRYLKLMSIRKIGRTLIKCAGRFEESIFRPRTRGESFYPRSDFFIVGAQKSGTTSLTFWLDQLPEFNMATMRVPHKLRQRIEIRFFSDPRIRMRGLKWYASRYIPGRINGEKCPEYLARKVSIEEIYRYNPGARIVVLLRNPVNRAFSTYQYYGRKRKRSHNWDWLLPDHTFEENLQAEVLTGFSIGILARGRYVEQIEYLYKIFPKEQVKIWILERILDDPEGNLRDLLSFLGAEPNGRDFEFLHRNRGGYATQLAEDTRRKLEDYYRPCNQRLYNLLGYTIPEWENQK